MKKCTNINELRFNLTEKMNNTMIEMLVIHQMLEESLKEDSKFTDKERGLLYNHFEKLQKDFRREFQKNNKKQIIIYNEIMKQKKKKDKQVINKCLSFLVYNTSWVVL